MNVPQDRPLRHATEEPPEHQGEWSPAVLARILAEAIIQAVEKSHDCVYDIIGIEYPDLKSRQPVHPRNLQGRTEITRILLKCRICNLPEVNEINGHWTADQIGLYSPPERM